MKRFSLLIPLLFLPGFAWATDMTANGVVREAFTAASVAIAGLNTVLLEEGKNLAWILSAISITWYALLFVLSGGEIQSLLGGLIRKLIVIGLVAMFLAGWGTAGPADMMRAVDGSFSAAAQKVMGTGGMSLGDGLSIFFNFISTVYSAIAQFPNSMNPAVWAGWLQNALILTLFNLLMLGAACAYACAYALSQYMIVVAAITGPILIPWYLLGSITSWLATGWLRFLATAAITKLVGGIVLIIANAMLGSIAKFADGLRTAIGNADPISQIAIVYNLNVAACAAVIVAAVVAYLMTKIFSIASGLTSGSAEAGEGFMAAASRVGGKLSPSGGSKK